MRVSVVTTSNDLRYLDRAYDSLQAQSFPDWEWIVLLTPKAPSWQPPTQDARVDVSRAPARMRTRGALKRTACESAAGEVLVELEPTDRLTRGCLAQVTDALADPEVALAYSDLARINADGSPNHEHLDPDYGWNYTRGTIEGTSYDRQHAFAPTPHNVAYSWYSPRHVRAFRRTTYDKVGGYDTTLDSPAGHELLTRLYRAGEFRQIKRCLYLEQAADELALDEEIVVRYRDSIEPLALAWAERAGLRCMRLRTPVWLGDEEDAGYEDVLVDPDDPRLEADDGSIGLIKAHDVLQRLPKRARFFSEVHRVLAHAGLILTQTPSTDGRGAFQDPSNTAFYNENSFMYLTQSALRAALPELNARLQVSHLRTFFATPAHEALDIPYVEANLLAIKDGPRQGGPLLC